MSLFLLAALSATPAQCPGGVCHAHAVLVSYQAAPAKPAVVVKQTTQTTIPLPMSGPGPVVKVVPERPVARAVGAARGWFAHRRAALAFWRGMP